MIPMLQRHGPWLPGEVVKRNGAWQRPPMNRAPKLCILLAAASVAGLSAEAADKAVLPTFYEAALCEPPYSTDTATALYEAAEKRAKPDMSKLGAAIYKLPEAIGQDGFSSNEVVFASTSIGVLVEGQVADQLAARYQLKPERSTILGTSIRGYSRTLSGAAEIGLEAGTISVVARESAALPGKTLLACEFVSDTDRQALDAHEKSAGQ